MPGQFELAVYYTCEGWKEDRVKEEDEYAELVTGKKIAVAKTSNLGVRELKFVFPTEAARSQAKSELKEGGFRFVP